MYTILLSLVCGFVLLYFIKYIFNVLHIVTNICSHFVIIIFYSSHNGTVHVRLLYSIQFGQQRRHRRGRYSRTNYILALDEIREMIIERMRNRDINTSYESENLVVNILKIGTDEGIISDSDSEDDVQLPPPSVTESDDVDCPVVIRELDEEVSVLAGLPDPHAAVTDGSVSVDPLPRRRRYFASAWRRIKRSALRLCCCGVR
uniref:Uncharacterized protein n=1 Tax=Schizaphis graminum TaxID=13262 RepID=A0A2S2PHY9_SCHGA